MIDRPRPTSDPRIEAVMDSLAVTAPDGNSPPYWRVEDALAAADAVDPLRVSLPPNSRQTNRAGVAPAGTPTKRIWPER